VGEDPRAVTRIGDQPSVPDLRAIILGMPDAPDVHAGQAILSEAAAEATPKAGFSIAATLRERIVRGELRAGEALPVESVLIEQFGGSKSVVREALRILEMEGLVKVRRGLGGGPRVTHPSIVTVTQAVGVHLQLQAVSIVDVWDAHVDLVLTAIGRLARLPGREAIAAVSASIDGLEEKTEVAEELVRQAGNTTQLVLISALREVIASELASADALVGYANTEVQTEIVQCLRTVVKHMKAGRPEAARLAYQREADQLADGLQQLLPGATVVDVFPWRMP
jgi:GntR family transcriptional regulator, transcriptional repressor for pyruvate dehydrogenase complex